MAAAAAAAAVPQGAASKWVPTPFYVAVVAAKHFSPIAALLPHCVNEPLSTSEFSPQLHVTITMVMYSR